MNKGEATQQARSSHDILPTTNAGSALVPSQNKNLDSTKEAKKTSGAPHAAEIVIFLAVGVALISFFAWDKSRTFMDNHAGSISATATIFIMLLTVFYALYARSQWKVMEGQLEQMSSSGNQTERLIKNADMQLELSTRPWVMAEMESAGPIAFDEAGARVNFSIKVTNVGHSPATSVDIRCKVINSQNPDILALQRELCRDPKDELPKDYSWGLALFPGKEFTQPIQETIVPSELDKTFVSFPKGTLLINVIGCVDYIIGSSREHRQTFFFYQLFGSDIQGKTLPFMRGTNVPTDRVKIFHGGYLGSSAT